MNVPTFRPNTWDLDIFRGVAILNEYKIPNKLKNIKVIDIGGHIGSFSWLCAKNGAKEIFYCEVLKENFDIGYQWIKENFLDKKVKKPVFALFNTAIWKDNELGEISFNKCSDPINTGGGSVINFIESDIKVPTFPFDEIIKLRLYKDDTKEKVLVKLDCEGSEYPILFSSKELNQIDYICGEYHELNTNIPDIAKVDGFDVYDAYALQDFLKKNGFEYTFFNRSKDDNGNEVGLGHFWASRTQEQFFIDINLSKNYQIKI